jgi:hypothetical protein
MMSEEKNLYIIDTVSMFRMAYCIKASSQEEAERIFQNSTEPVEYGQDHIGENVFGVVKASIEDYMANFDEMNNYLKNISDELKLSYIME